MSLNVFSSWFQLVLQVSLFSTFLGEFFRGTYDANHLVIYSIGTFLASATQAVVTGSCAFFRSKVGGYIHPIYTRISHCFCSQSREARFLDYLVLSFAQQPLVTILLGLLKCTRALNRWIEILIQALGNDQGQIARDSSRRKSMLGSKKRSRTQYRKTRSNNNRNDTVTRKKAARPAALSIRIPSTYLLTPPATPDTGYHGEIYPGTTRAAILPQGISRTLNSLGVPRITPSQSSATSLDSVAAIAKPEELSANDPLASFDCTSSFMSCLTLDEKTGDGAYGSIYRGIGRCGKLFAIKIMERDGTLDQDAAFREEIDAMKRAANLRWVAKLRYWQHSNKHLLLAMSFFSGGNIYDYTRSHKTLKSELVVFWTAEILLAIHSLHTLGIIHRDIKPENIMLSTSGHIKIIDFGLAKLFDHDSVSREQYPLFHSLKRMGGDLFPQIWALESNPHTTNEAFGTQGFAPPEVWQRKHYSYGVDYFAMACVLHELLTNKLPFFCDRDTGDYDVMTIVVDPECRLEEVQRDFLIKALMPNPVLRPSVSHMKKHPLFKQINWTALSRFELKPPMSL